jgi:hypothetical protein
MPPLHIKPFEPDYMVAALANDIHSLFGGRKPQRREDRSKRARRFIQNGCFWEDAIRSPFSGRKLRRREDTTPKKTTARKNQGLANPALEGWDNNVAEGRSI